MTTTQQQLKDLEFIENIDLINDKLDGDTSSNYINDLTELYTTLKHFNQLTEDEQSEQLTTLFSGIIQSLVENNKIVLDLADTVHELAITINLIADVLEDQGIATQLRDLADTTQLKLVNYGLDGTDSDE